jgi:hypothetical protein
VLQEFYGGNTDEGIPNTIPALVEWGIAIGDPITVDTPAELKGERLASISSTDIEGIVVSREQFSQMALLQPEVLNRCQEEVEKARALLGLILCHLAPHDPSWRKERIVTGRKPGQEVPVKVRGALWLADLRCRAWVPIKRDDGKLDKTVASATTLRGLLKSGVARPK